MFNHTNYTSNKVEMDKIAVNVIAMIFGSWSVIGNGIIVITIGFSKQLRDTKEMIIVGGMAVGDAIYGFGFLYGGARRLYLVIANEFGMYVTRWYCMLEVASFFYIVGPQIGSIMNLVISVDRFIAVAFYNYYKAVTPRMLKMATFLVYVYAMVSYLVGLMISFNLPRNAIVFKQCLSSWTTSKAYVTFYTTQIVLCASTSVVIYFVVMILMKMRTNNATGAAQEMYYQHQVQVTKTLGIVTLVTLVFYVIPWLVNITLTVLKVQLGKASFISPVMWQMIIFNNCANVMIYMWKFTDMRRAFLKMIKRKPKIKPALVSVQTSSTGRRLAFQDTAM